YNLGNILRALGKLQEAEESIRKAIELKPDFVEAHSNLGLVLKNLGNLSDAELSLRKAIELKPDFANAYSNLGTILKDLGNLHEAELSLRKAIALKPDFANAYSNLGTILKNLGNLKEAELFQRKAIELKPDFASAYLNLGNTLRDLGNLKEAELFQRKAIELKPDFVNAFLNLGNTLRDLGNLKEAQLSLSKAFKLQPESAITNHNMGMIFNDLGKYHTAIKFFKKSIELDNDSVFPKWGLITSKGYICDWSNHENQNKWLEKLGIEGSPVIPLSLFYYEDNPLKQLKRAQNLYKKKYQKETKSIGHFKNKKIHIGYFSADFRAHPMMYLMSSMFKLHDKSKFKVYLYSFVNKEDEYTKIAKESGCIYRDIKELNDLEAVELARSDRLDIAIDRMGYVSGNRMNIFSYRVAPIQIHYMAYAGTLGADSIDYLIADNIIIPKEYEKYYSEKIIRMPNTYQCNDNKKEICKEPITRKEFNLPEEAFVFTCFCANKKITPQEFDIWMKLLRSINGSVLWLYKSNDYSEKNLIYEAEKRKVDPDRLIFANKLPLKKHLARHALGDLALDTFNYNGHTTTSDALWAGLPVLTKIGESFSARVSASLLNSIGLSELITSSKQEYEKKALKIASNPNELIRLKTKLAQSRETSPLYNSELFTRDLESKFKDLLNK
ncbi:tetratricopeptide repeat protein, partial [Prochlorococcus marinus]